MSKSLYAYFGLLELHTIDSPGHSLYQIGLIDSIQQTFSESKFDFYSYYPKENIYLQNIEGRSYPEGELGRLFQEYRDELIDEYLISFDKVIENISQRKYHTLYLKARFRNLSTLSKKWRDALRFEEIIAAAIAAGYPKEKIIILDTDLSLSQSFINRIQDSATILTPSIDFPGISDRFLNRCVEIHTGKFDKKLLNCIFYGNIDTSSYKSGNSKGEILTTVLDNVDRFTQSIEGSLIVICKNSEEVTLTGKNHRVARHNREIIWKTLEDSAIMLNVTKDIYDQKKFIPARIFEAMIFGLIPISYRFNFLCPAFSFTTEEDLSEILKYLFECSPADLEKAYLHFIKSYKNYKI
jgi:hypothetical protein